MKKYSISLLSTAIAAVIASGSAMAAPENITQAITDGTAYGDVRLRYENVSDDSAAKDADALTVRTRLGYVTGAYEGLSATVEFEDSRTVSVSDFNSTQNGKAEYSKIVDPETTELDQAFLQYQRGDLTAKLGSQVITYDNHRFIGHVGWRQDRQTFDALTLKYALDDLTFNYAYIGERNRILAEAGDVESKDHLVNVGYASPIGKVSAYAYLLEVDNNTDNAIDTYGIRLAGSTDLDGTKLLYTAEYATQTNEVGASENDTDYFLLEGGAAISGITAKLGYESLGSDDGQKGFATPLATGHKFNGWADQFLGTPDTGLVDAYLTLSTKAMGAKLALTYHEFSSDEDNGAGDDDLGSELDLLVAKKFSKNYSAGIKYAAYSSGDDSFGKVDTDKLWLWGGINF